MPYARSYRSRLRSIILAYAFCAVFLTGFVAGAGSAAGYLFLQPSIIPMFGNARPSTSSVIRASKALPACPSRSEQVEPDSNPNCEIAAGKFYSTHAPGSPEDVIHLRSSPPPGTERPADSVMSPALHDWTDTPRAIEIQRRPGYRATSEFTPDETGEAVTRSTPEAIEARPAKVLLYTSENR